MKPSWLISLKEQISRDSKKPWACFETAGPGEDGNVEFKISANKAFIKNLKKMGIEGSTDEETVQLFFLQMHMIPTNFDNDETEVINPSDLPNLTNEANQLIR